MPTGVDGSNLAWYKSLTLLLLRTTGEQKLRLLALGGSAMRTTILAYVIALMGLIMMAAGTWGLFLLVVEKTVRVPLRYYAIPLGMISGGLAMGGVAQALRLLLVVSGRG
jgi:hypothetical protein